MGRSVGVLVIQGGATLPVLEQVRLKVWLEAFAKGILLVQARLLPPYPKGAGLPQREKKKEQMLW